MIILLLSCGPALQSNTVESKPEKVVVTEVPAILEPLPAAVNVPSYLQILKGKNVAVVANQTSMIQGTHMVDSLIALGIDVRHIYTPEHGFRGDADAGAHINDEKDQKTGLQIYSLHGKSKKPSAESLKNIDIVLFDIQDVGVRFYTYISTLHYVMEACAESGVKIIVLDRPNPLANTIDGPTLDPKFSSFIGKHPVPMVYGMTIGEYALMINGEGWLKEKLKAELQVIPCLNYDHQTQYNLPIPPSPNLPNQASVYLYPSLCLFEGTVVSLGRGTDHPFEIAGHPDFEIGAYKFTPLPNRGSSDPPLKGKLCKGQFYGPERAQKVHDSRQLDLSILLTFYNELSPKLQFFNADGFFELLAGTDVLRRQIEQGMSEEEIRISWQEDLEKFKVTRKKYLIYQD